MIYGHGDDLFRYTDEIKYNFSSNVYYKGSPPELLTYISSAIDSVQNYPSPAAEELNEAVAKRFQLDKNHFLFTNGATEAFYLIAQMFSGKSAGIFAPTFTEYEDACKVHGLNYDLVDKTWLRPQDYHVVFICNPNNPDGMIIPTKKLVQYMEHAPNTTFVIDEAYIEFTNQLKSLIALVEHFDNLIVVRSLTKTFAIPGIRLGYLAASPKTVERLLSYKMPWTENALAIEAGLQLFGHYDQWLFNVEELLEETKAFVYELSAINWLKVKPTHTSYFLIEIKKGKASELKEYLVKEHGILIRDATNFKRIDGEYIRLSTQSKDANRALINALKRWK
mgnify:CR=1 FL=1